MTKQTNTSITAMEAQRRELDRRIRAAKRAVQKAGEQALLSARHDLGVEVTTAAGADNLEAVERLRRALMSGQMIGSMKEQIDTGSLDNSATGDASAEVAQVADGGGHHVA